MSNLSFFLLNKDKYEQIIYNINDIINNYKCNPETSTESKNKIKLLKLLSIAENNKP